MASQRVGRLQGKHWESTFISVLPCAVGLRFIEKVQKKIIGYDVFKMVYISPDVKLIKKRNQYMINVKS